MTYPGIVEQSLSHAETHDKAEEALKTLEAAEVISKKKQKILLLLLLFASMAPQRHKLQRLHCYNNAATSQATTPSLLQQRFHRCNRVIVSQVAAPPSLQHNTATSQVATPLSLNCRAIALQRRKLQCYELQCYKLQVVALRTPTLHLPLLQHCNATTCNAASLAGQLTPHDDIMLTSLMTSC